MLYSAAALSGSIAKASWKQLAPSLNLALLDQDKAEQVEDIGLIFGAPKQLPANRRSLLKAAFAIMRQRIR
jgi:hypothetical protein